MEAAKQHGGARPGAGHPHEHREYLLVEVIDFYGDKDLLVIGPVSWIGASREAHKVAAHHVGEQAQSVKIVKRLCCSHGESAVVETVKCPEGRKGKTMTNVTIDGKQYRVYSLSEYRSAEIEDEANVLIARPCVECGDELLGTPQSLASGRAPHCEPGHCGSRPGVHY